MEIGLSFPKAVSAALDAARAAETVAARAARRAEWDFERARAFGGGDVQAAAERFRAAHRAHVEARIERGEVEAAREDALAA